MTMASSDHIPAPASDPSAEASVRRVRHTVLERIAQVSTPRHTTIPADSEGWQPFLEGIQLKVLSEQPDALSYLLLLEPGAVLPAHRHPQDEECVVIQGELRIGDALVVGAGAYHLGKAGVLHARIVSDTGALLFLRGAAPEGAHFL